MAHADVDVALGVEEVKPLQTYCLDGLVGRNDDTVRVIIAPVFFSRDHIPQNESVLKKEPEFTIEMGCDILQGIVDCNFHFGSDRDERRRAGRRAVITIGTATLLTMAFLSKGI